MIEPRSVDYSLSAEGSTVITGLGRVTATSISRTARRRRRPESLGRRVRGGGSSSSPSALCGRPPSGWKSPPLQVVHRWPFRARRSPRRSRPTRLLSTSSKSRYRQRVIEPRVRHSMVDGINPARAFTPSTTTPRRGCRGSAPPMADGHPAGRGLQINRYRRLSPCPRPTAGTPCRMAPRMAGRGRGTSSKIHVEVVARWGRALGSEGPAVALSNRLTTSSRRLDQTNRTRHGELAWPRPVAVQTYRP